MKRSRREKSPWIKSKTKPGPNKKKIIEFHPDRRQNLAESDKDSWLSQLSGSEAASASSLDVSAVSEKKIMGVKKAEESNVTGEQPPKTSPDCSSSLDSSLSFRFVLGVDGLFCLWKANSKPKNNFIEFYIL